MTTLHPTRRRRWLPLDDRVLRVVYPFAGLATAATTLGRSKLAVSERRRSLGIVANRKRGPGTALATDRPTDRPTEEEGD